MTLRRAVVFALLLAVAAVKCAEESGFIVTVIPNMSEFLDKHPGADLTPLELVNNADEDAPARPAITRTYRIGFRIAGKKLRLIKNYSMNLIESLCILSGDRLLAQDQAQQSWVTPQDVNVNLSYPQRGIGAVITYLEVVVDQVLQPQEEKKKNLRVFIETIFFSILEFKYWTSSCDWWWHWSKTNFSCD